MSLLLKITFKEHNIKKNSQVLARFARSYIIFYILIFYIKFMRHDFETSHLIKQNHAEIMFDSACDILICMLKALFKKCSL